MSATNAFETSLLQLILNAAPIANIADNTATSPATLVYISLHTADPGETGNQSTSETGYTSYARVSVARSSSGWTVTGNTASNAGVITFPACSGGTSTVTHFGIGLSATGTGTLLLKGALTASLAVSNGITPRYAIGDLTVTAD